MASRARAPMHSFIRSVLMEHACCGGLCCGPVLLPRVMNVVWARSNTNTAKAKATKNGGECKLSIKHHKDGKRCVQHHSVSQPRALSSHTLARVRLAIDS